jgi:hypothetical protein
MFNVIPSTPLYDQAAIDAAVAAERERCSDIAKARADKIATKAEQAKNSYEHDAVISLRTMAWQLTVVEREIRGPNTGVER